MNHDQRKSFRIQIPEGREHASLFIGKRQIGVRVLDESAGGFAVALLTDEDVQQNQVHVLKTATGLYETRVARVEHFEDGKLLGLMRLQDLSDTGEAKLKVSSWWDYFYPPQQSTSGGGGGLVVGIGATAVVGVLICIVAACFIRYSPSRRSGETSPYLKEYTEALTEEIEKAREAAKDAERLAREKAQKSGTTYSAQYLRQQARISQEVLYRLQLSSDQSRRIRDILSRTSGDISAAEAEIRSVLTAEQARQWQSLAP